LAERPPRLKKKPMHFFISMKEDNKLGKGLEETSRGNVKTKKENMSMERESLPQHTRWGPE